MRSSLWIVFAVLIAAGCGNNGFELHRSSAALRAAERPGFTREQRRIADQIISVFENDTPRIQYAYIENLKDGRGYTAGRAGFTSGTDDMISLVRTYSRRKPGNPLAQFIPLLTQKAHDGDDSVDDLKDLHFREAWITAARDPAFRKAQDDVVDQQDYFPALDHWRQLGLKTPLGLLVLYDTIIEHGNGGDADGTPVLIKKTNEIMGGSPRTGIFESKWLLAFLKRRRDTLAHPTNALTTEQWKHSVVRCDALQMLVKKKNFDLKPPLTIKAYDDDPVLIK